MAETIDTVIVRLPISKDGDFALATLKAKRLAEDELQKELYKRGWIDSEGVSQCDINYRAALLTGSKETSLMITAYR
jgi:hypothetical protein